MWIIERLIDYIPGDIIKLKVGAFKKYPGNTLVKSGHLFAVVDEDHVCVISSNNSKVNEKYPYNIEIIDYSSAGLRKPSHVKVDVSGTIEDSEVFDYVGHLSNEDLVKVVNAYKNAPLHTLLEYLRKIEESN